MCGCGRVGRGLGGGLSVWVCGCVCVCQCGQCVVLKGVCSMGRRYVPIPSLLPILATHASPFSVPLVFIAPISLCPLPFPSSSSALAHVYHVTAVVVFARRRPVGVRARVSHLAVVQVLSHMISPRVLVCAVGGAL